MLRIVEGKAVVVVRTVVVRALNVVDAKVLAVVRAVLLVNNDEAVVAGSWLCNCTELRKICERMLSGKLVRIFHFKNEYIHYE